MTEKEILEKIKESAEKIEIPKSLEPEEIEKMLELKKISENNPHEKTASGEKYSTDKGIVYRFSNKKVIAAASVLLVCGVCGIAAVKSGIPGFSGDSLNMKENVAVGEDVANEETAGDESMVSEENLSGGEQENIGELYQVASGYAEVYELLDRYMYEDYTSTDNIFYDTIFREEMNASAKDEEMSAEGSQFTAGNDIMKEEVADEAGGAVADGDYSTTNLQTQGVDESDIVKTDGKYIYTVSQNQILITDIQKDKLEKAGIIQLNLDAQTENLLEMYVDDGKVILITSKYDTSLAEKHQFSMNGETTYVTEDLAETDATVQGISKDEAESIIKNSTAEEAIISEVSDVDTLETGMEETDVPSYYIEREVSTVIYTYDVTKPEEPKLLGKIKQDGSYHTSRKIGDIVYLFTDENLYDNVQPTDETMRDSGAYLPLVNEEEIPYDRIYLPKEGSQALIISSVNVSNPSAIVDKAMILNNYVEIYVGNESCYLYNSDYQNGKDVTEIAKFTFTEGSISAESAATVEGMIYDTFAINEKNGKLRVLTTTWDDNYYQQSNNLYLLDEQLSVTGKLKEIAPDEEIYAARYIGDIAYFITYRNIDPLFAVDISDETAPKILGELEITGFSEYLHPWGEDKLLGIGYETDPDTGIQQGIKLVMFDISNPTKLKILDTLVIENVDYCAALYNYKCIIAEENANIIGFATETYTSSYSQREINYLAFAWENGKFVNLLTEGLTSGVDCSIYRGVYAGDNFYIASPEQIRSFNRTESYKKLDELVF